MSSAGNFLNCRLVQIGKALIDAQGNTGQDAQTRHFKPHPQASSSGALPFPGAMRANIAGIGKADDVIDGCEASREFFWNVWNADDDAAF